MNNKNRDPEKNSSVTISSENAESDGKIPPIFQICSIILTLIGIGASVFHLFGFNIAGKVMWPRAYYSLLIGCFLPLIFLYDSSGYRLSGKKYLNILGALMSIGAAAFFFLNAFNIEYKSWEYDAPTSALIGAFILLIVVFWALKKSSGRSFFFIGLCFLCFPLFAQYIPGALKGTGFTALEALQYYVFGTEAVFGLVMDVMGNLVLGFLVFAGVLQYTGGGDFFLNLAFALVGNSRGGPAKVAVIASGFFGSINGAPIVNVATTGAITIPAMKKLGYSATYAGAVEACASTGGVFMPPIMGATAFIMCQVLGVSYSTIVTAAFIPALLFYISLLLQVDAYAVKADLKGLASDDLPSLWTTLKEGWPYLLSLGFLVFQLVYLRVIVLSPYYATILLLITVMIRKNSRLRSRKGWMEMIESTGKTISMILSLLLGVGFILGSLMMTGVAFAFSHEIIKLAMGDPMLLLFFGALISFFLGMGMTISAVYVILAMTVAPPLVKMGFDPIAVHLFVVYYGMLSSITPPVALAAFGAAGISGASPLKTGIMAVRIGIILFIVPFVFVLQPALIFQGPINETVYLVLTFLIGIVFVVGGTEGYVHGLGKLGKIFSPLRIASLIGGLLIIAPNTYAKIIGAIIIALLIFTVYLKRKSQKSSLNST